MQLQALMQQSLLVIFEACGKKQMDFLLGKFTLFDCLFCFPDATFSKPGEQKFLG